MNSAGHQEIFFPIVRRLQDITKSVRMQLSSEARVSYGVQIVYAFVLKAERILSAIRLLHEHGQWGAADALVRVLFELQVNFLHFLPLYQKDPIRACARLVDGMMLDTMKTFRCADYPLPSAAEKGRAAADHERIEEVIQSDGTGSRVFRSHSGPRRSASDLSTTSSIGYTREQSTQPMSLRLSPPVPTFRALMLVGMKRPGGASLYTRHALPWQT